MSRSVVFRTPGKLDLRALTVFGMSAKPESQNPIGFFGTGLKYATAVIARHDLPMTIWIGEKKWEVKRVHTDFRGKQVDELYIVNKRKIGSRAIRLPFTVELGKTWELWQAFRELYANTLDENGETSTWSNEFKPATVLKGQDTHIVVEGEKFVQEFLQKDKIFLPDALRIQHTAEPVQCFERKSQHVYWRGMRILDLKEPSEFTWNILAPISITEDRTAKWEWEVQNKIEEYLRNHAPKELVTKAVTTPSKSYERRLPFDYHYSAPSPEFIAGVKEAPSDQVLQSAAKHVASYEPPPPKEEVSHDQLIPELILAIKLGDWDRVEELIDTDRDFVIQVLHCGVDIVARTAASDVVTEI